MAVAMIAATGAVMAMVMGMVMSVEMVMVMGMAVVMAMLVGMLMAVGVTVVGMLVGMGMLMGMIVRTAQMIVVNMHINDSFSFFLHYNNLMPGCQSIYFPVRTPVGACTSPKNAV